MLRILSVKIVISIIPLTAMIVPPAHSITLEEAARIAVKTNPVIGEAGANRKAVGQELNQAIGAFFPRLDVSGATGRQKITRPNSLPSDISGKWRSGRQVSVTGTQVLFKGFERVYDLYRQASRVDAAALRVLERSEFIALQVSETYIDIVRLRRLRSFAQRNVAKHREILRLVRDRESGGKSPKSSVLQVKERFDLARATLRRIEQELGEASATFLKLVGRNPHSLSSPRVPRAVPRSVSSAIADAKEFNSVLRLRDADVDTALFDYKRTKSLFLPEVSLQGRASYSDDFDGVRGQDDEQSVLLRFNWNVFNGGQNIARRAEQAQRWSEAQIRLDVERRNVLEVVRRAWVAYAVSRRRISALRSRETASRQLVAEYREEYEVNRRSLLDLLDAQNSLFNSQVELSNVKGIFLFASFRLLAATGRILDALGIEVSEDAREGARGRFGVTRRYPEGRPDATPVASRYRSRLGGWDPKVVATPKVRTTGAKSNLGAWQTQTNSWSPSVVKPTSSRK